MYVLFFDREAWEFCIPVTRIAQVKKIAIGLLEIMFLH